MSCLRHVESFFPIAAITIAAMLAVGCSSATNSAMPAAGAAKVIPAPQVSVATATTETVIDEREFTGRTAAVAAVEVRPRVSGYLLQTPRALDQQLDSLSSSKPGAPKQTSLDESLYHVALETQPPPRSDADSTSESAPRQNLFVVKVQEGDFVTAGTPLFEIDPAPYRLAYLQAAGSLDAAKAQLSNYRRDLARQKELLPSNATSQSSYDEAAANVAETMGNIENLKATVDRAYLDWTYTQLRSPISGFVGDSQLTLGNLAIADSTILTTVGSIDPIYVYFEVDENSVLDYLSRLQSGQVLSAREAKIEVRMSLANETTYPHHGVIDFVDNSVDSSTGNFRLRAKFVNSDRKLLPGLFARVRVPFNAPHHAITIPTAALATDQQGQYVMIVDDQNHARRRSIVAGKEQGDRTVISDGISAGETVIVSGLQRVRDGLEVRVSSDNTKPAEKQLDSQMEPGN